MNEEGGGGGVRANQTVLEVSGLKTFVSHKEI